MPPPNGSIGSITDGSTSTAETFRQQNWRTPTTVKPSPAIRSGAQKQSDRTRRGDSRRLVGIREFAGFVLAVVALISLVGEPPGNLETYGPVEVGDAAAIVAVSGGEQAGLTGAVVDEPSGRAGPRGCRRRCRCLCGHLGRGRAPRGGSGRSPGGSAAAVTAAITPQQLIAAAAIAPRAHVVVYAISPVSLS